MLRATHSQLQAEAKSPPLAPALNNPTPTLHATLRGFIVTAPCLLAYARLRRRSLNFASQNLLFKIPHKTRSGFENLGFQRQSLKNLSFAKAKFKNLRRSRAQASVQGAATIKPRRVACRVGVGLLRERGGSASQVAPPPPLTKPREVKEFKSFNFKQSLKFYSKQSINFNEAKRALKAKLIQ